MDMDYVFIWLLILFYFLGPFLFYPKEGGIIYKIYYFAFCFVFTPFIGIPLFWYLWRH